MGLKQSIVIVNEYTIKTQNGGTRGGTPGDYVLRYMSRKGAVENVAPIRHDTEDYVVRYMARESAVENALSVENLKADMRQIDGMGGVAFGYGSFSLSDAKLKSAAKDIQKNFDAGKTVLKTVISFDPQYLKERKIVDDDFEIHERGDYRGNIDQMKLRMAIMNGMDKLGRTFDDMQYIGVIQVDTKHVHCHLAIVDRGRGRLAQDGTQKGKITSAEQTALRRGIDMYLDEKQAVKMMVANVQQDRHNTVCYVKKFTYKAMQNQGFAQMLLSCLPEDKNMWRASSKRKEMRKANSIVREYVEQLFEQPDSGYSDAMAQVDKYASARANRENLTGQQYRALQKQGRDRIVEQSMNSVYQVLKQIPQSAKTVSTPMIDAMSMPYEDMAREASADPMVEFGFRLRSYKTRLDHHRKERDKYHDAVEDYDKQKNADPSSIVLRDYFKIEEEYNAMLAEKYGYFLRFIPPDQDYQDGLNELLELDKRVENFGRMMNDPTIKKMLPENAEQYCNNVYDERGGRYFITDPSVMTQRFESLKSDYDTKRVAYTDKLKSMGLNLDDNNALVRYTQYDFDDIKALDLHHLLYDFPHDFNISNDNVDKFVAMADSRYQAFQAAKTYLESTGQGDLAANFPENDINQQSQVADRFRIGEIFRAAREEPTGQKHEVRTVRSDYEHYYDYELDIKNLIKNTLNTLQYE